MYKATVFQTELGYIQNEDFRKAISKVVHELPDYFFTIPASSSGKYHPDYALGEGGLVRHTKAAVKIAADLLNREYNLNKFTPMQRDIMIAALILHDGLKHGYEDKAGHTISEHPVVMSNYLRDNYSNLFTPEVLQLLRACIVTHMGQWNTNYDKVPIMPKPTSEMQWFVHMCDYLASRKYLEVSFDIGLT